MIDLCLLCSSVTIPAGITIPRYSNIEISRYGIWLMPYKIMQTKYKYSKPSYCYVWVFSVEKFDINIKTAMKDKT